jgi:hypothetical protein
VSDDIIVRINQDFNALASTSRDIMARSVVDALRKATSFWSYGDNPEKYLRIGRDKMVLGNFVGEWQGLERFGGSKQADARQAAGR